MKFNSELVVAILENKLYPAADQELYHMHRSSEFLHV